ncbi:MAG: cobalamin biosynthesis protein [Gammaproteobacteria bacterium]
MTKNINALSYACVGRFLPAWRCWRSQARFWESSNAGTVMATGAGALGVRLGGTAVYHGLVKDRPQLGAGEAPRVEHIVCAVELVKRALWLWLALILCGGLAF